MPVIDDGAHLEVGNGRFCACPILSIHVEKVQSKPETRRKHTLGLLIARATPEPVDKRARCQPCPLHSSLGT